MTYSHVVFKMIVFVTFTLLSSRLRINFFRWFPGSRKIQSIFIIVQSAYVQPIFRKIDVLNCRSKIEIGVQNDGELL